MVKESATRLGQSFAWAHHTIMFNKLVIQSGTWNVFAGVFVKRKGLENTAVPFLKKSKLNSLLIVFLIMNPTHNRLFRL